MSSVLAMVLMAAMAIPGNGPEKVSGEMEQELDLSGEWKGVWSVNEPGWGAGNDVARLAKGKLNDCVLGRVVDEGHGRCRFHLDDVLCLGIYRQDGGCLVICFRYACSERGYPRTFETGGKRHLLILHRVKPGK